MIGASGSAASPENVRDRQAEQHDELEEARRILEGLARAVAPASDVVLEQIGALLGTGVDPAAGPASPKDRAVTERRKAEARYRALVEQIPAVTFLAPLDGTVSELYVSPQIEALLGFTAREWLDDPVLWYKQLHPDDKERWQAEFARTVNSATHFRAEYRFIARSGRVVWVHGEAKVVSDDEGRPMFLQGVAFDITESKEAEQALRGLNADLTRARDQALEASRAKSAFLANMSHELRTPLNAIIGYSEILQEDALEAGHNTYIADLEKIHSSSKHLLSLINDVLDLSKVEAGKMEMYIEEFSLVDTIEDVVSTIRPMAEKNGNSLKIAAQDMGMIRADKTKLRQVLLNLLSNACKFTTNGAIVFTADYVGQDSRQWIELSVADTGIGISRDQIDKLFRDFSQVDDTSTRKYGGTGLGLAISRRFCRLMGGDIYVESEVEKGTTFRVRLPAVFVRTPQDPSKAEEPALADDRREVVLSIDDDPTALDILKRYLSKEGFRVATATSGDEGLRLARELKPAAITLDVVMPGMDGWTVLAALKSEPELAAIPVIIVSMAADRNVGFALGATSFLAKPIQRDTLATTLRKHRLHRNTFSVLLVDDDEDARKLVARALSEEGCQLVEVASGRIALDELSSGCHPDLILLDLIMPDMDGFEFLEEFRRNPAWSEIPVVVLTSKDLTLQDRARLNDKVAQMFLKGEVSREELARQLRRLIAAGKP